MTKCFLKSTLILMWVGVSAAAVMAQTTPLTSTETPEAVPIRARATPLPPPRATMSDKGAVVAPLTQAPRADAPAAVKQAPAVKQLPTPQINEADVGFPVLPVDRTARPGLPALKDAPRAAPSRETARGAPIGAPNTLAPMMPSQPNTVPPQAGSGSRVTPEGAAAAPDALAQAKRARNVDDLSTLTAPPGSPQTRPLPGLGSAPGTIASANPQIIRTRSGVNHLVPLALIYPNRIVTPFKRPEVIDDGLEVLVKGNSVYIKLDDANPRGVIFIHDGDAPAGPVIQLTVIGRAIPPQTIITQLDSTSGVVEASDDSDYVSSLKTLIRTFIRGGVPQGYTEEALDVPMASASNALLIQPERRFSSATNETLRYSIQNVSNQAITLSEEMFGDANVRAVSFSPLRSLLPGEKTTVFIVAKLKEE